MFIYFLLLKSFQHYCRTLTPLQRRSRGTADRLRLARKSEDLHIDASASLLRKSMYTGRNLLVFFGSSTKSDNVMRVSINDFISERCRVEDVTYWLNTVRNEQNVRRSDWCLNRNMQPEGTNSVAVLHGTSTIRYLHILLIIRGHLRWVCGSYWHCGWWWSRVRVQRRFLDLRLRRRIGCMLLCLSSNDQQMHAWCFDQKAHLSSHVSCNI